MKDENLAAMLDALVAADAVMRKLPEKKLGNVTIMESSLLYLRVCSSMNVEDTLRYVNEVCPPGTTNNKWGYTDEPLPGSGDARMVQCADAEGRKHYVFNC